MAGCEWIESNQKFKEEHYHPVIMYIPNSLTNCRKKTQEELEEEAMIRNQIKELRPKYIESTREAWYNRSEIMEKLQQLGTKIFFDI